MGVCLLSSYLLFGTRYICEVFDGILMYIFHEPYSVGFWDPKVGKFIN